MIWKTVKSEFSDTLDELVDVTQQRMINSKALLWASIQLKSVEAKSKIKALTESVQVPSFAVLLLIVLIYCIYSIDKKSKAQGISLALYSLSPRILAVFVDKSQCCH